MFCSDCVYNDDSALKFVWCRCLEQTQSIRHNSETWRIFICKLDRLNEKEIMIWNSLLNDFRTDPTCSRALHGKLVLSFTLLHIGLPIDVRMI